MKVNKHLTPILRVPGSQFWSSEKKINPHSSPFAYILDLFQDFRNKILKPPLLLSSKKLGSISQTEPKRIT